MANTTVHFTGIRKVILEELKEATTSIKIAMSWFTNREITFLLISKSEAWSIDLIINDDIINRNFSKFDFQDLIKANCKLYLYSNDTLMHNKFCIIDDKKLITGSYNWTDKAERNEENIMVTDQLDSVTSYVANFQKLIFQKQHIMTFEREEVSNNELMPLCQFLLPEDISRENKKSVVRVKEVDINNHVSVIYNGEHEDLFDNLGNPKEYVIEVNFETRDKVAFTFYKGLVFYYMDNILTQKEFHRNRFSTTKVSFKLKVEKNILVIYSIEEGSNAESLQISIPIG